MYSIPHNLVAAASNIKDGKNPAFTAQDFRKIMPGFSSDIISDDQLQHFVNLAHSIVKEARWHDMWKEAMRLFIAHCVAIYLQTPQDDADPAILANAGKVQGAATSKAVGGVSISYDVTQATSDLTGWAAFKLTSYGTQYATLAKLVGIGGMYVP